MDVFAAADRGALGRVRALVEQDADLVHATQHEGWTPLLCAASRGHAEIAGYLLDHDATVDHWACCFGHTRVVLLLLQREADIQAVDVGGWTPLMFTGRPNYTGVVRVLLEHGGADVDAADDDGRTACHHACGRDSAGVVKQLLEAGADPALRDSEGIAARGIAATRQRHACLTVFKEWDRAYLLQRVRHVRDASWAASSNTL